jgi:hypothetical protein
MFASLVFALKRTMKNTKYVFLTVYLNNNSEKYVAQQRVYSKLLKIRIVQSYFNEFRQKFCCRMK